MLYSQVWFPPVIDYMSYLQSPGTQGQNRPNRLSIYKSSMNTVVFVNASIVLFENLFLALLTISSSA